MLNKLAQGQSLAVLEGTATPHSYARINRPRDVTPVQARLGVRRLIGSISGFLYSVTAG